MSSKKNGLIMLSAMASASVMMTSVAMANSQIETAVIDISGVVHFNPQGNAGNTKIQFNVPNGATIAIRAVGWNGTYSTFGTSWVSEAVISFADQGQPPALFVTPGAGNDAPGQNVPLSSNGLITLGSVNIPNIPVFSGVVELEFFDTFQDDPNGPEGVWGKGSTISIQYRVVKGGACPADLNNSGAVDVQDLLILLGAWGTNPGHPADLNNSGAVDVQDLLILLGAWGPCPPSAVVTGACCYFTTQTCDDLTQADCNASSGGSYAGDWTECATWACPTPPDGTSCAEAVQIALNTPTRLSTVGNAVPTFAQCSNAPAPSAGVAWYRITGNGTQYTAASCGSGLGSVRVAVFCGTCTSLACIAGEFEDPDANCGNSFQAAATWCAANGINYYIAVYGAGASEGNVLLTVTSDNSSCTPASIDCGILGDPVCTLPDTQCQERSGGSYTNSNTDSFKVADDFNAAATGNITSVCWQGVELVFAGGFNVCPDNDGQGLPFMITYYNDASGVPGTVKAGPFTVQPTYSRIAFIGFAFGNAGLIDYTATHPAVPVTAGTCYWIEIKQVHAGSQCLFLWAPSDQGNFVGYQRADDGQPYTLADKMVHASGNHDRTFCVNIAQGPAANCLPTTGACCVGGVCQGTLTQDACLALGCGATWAAGQTCPGFVCAPATACTGSVGGTGPNNCVNGTRPGDAGGGWNNGTIGTMKDLIVGANSSITQIRGDFLALAGAPTEIYIRVYNLNCGTMASLDPLTATPILSVTGTVGVNATRTALGPCSPNNWPVDRWSVTLPAPLNLPPGKYAVWFSFNLTTVGYFHATGGNAPNGTSVEPTRIFGINNVGGGVNAATTQQSSYCVGN